MKTLYVECNMGAAGDMLMAALYELLDENEKQQFLDKMNGLIPGVKVTPAASVKCGIQGTHMNVRIHGEEETVQDIPCGVQAEEIHTGTHEHAHCHDHEYAHEHSHDHEDSHEHEHGHEYAHSHDHEHNHEHSDSHEHSHSHDHEHDFSQGPVHCHGAGHTHAHHAMADIRAIVDGFDLPDSVKEQVKKVYGEIAEAESAAHNCPVEEVHFHEVGALDAVADVTGVCYLMYLAAPERVVVSPIHLGSGNVRCAHGILPVPAPATAWLLKDIPCYQGEIRGELCTPTGAALLKCFADSFGPMPRMAISRTGYGMGMKDFAQANCVRVFLGQEEKNQTAFPNGKAVELSANLDDMTPEQMGYAVQKLLSAGALDVYCVPAFMKKNRPAYVMTCICREEQAGELAVEMLRNTTTFGVRRRDCERYTMEVSFEEKVFAEGTVRVKTGKGYGISKSKPEYEDMVALMEKTGRTWKEIEAEL